MTGRPGQPETGTVTAPSRHARGHSGPFDTAADVLALPAVQAAYDAARRHNGPGRRTTLTAAMIDGALNAAGVTLGAHDRRIVAWLAVFGPEEAAVVCGWITRAHEAGRTGGAR